MIPVPLDQKRRKKLRAQLQEDQRRHRERQSVLAASCSPNESPPQSLAADLLEGHERNKVRTAADTCDRLFGVDSSHRFASTNGRPTHVSIALFPPPR